MPSTNDRFLIGTIIFPRSKHIDQCLSLLRSDQLFGHYSRKKTKNKDCANRNRHVPSATDRLSTGTVIFPMSKHIDYCLSQSDRTSRSDGIREKAKNKVCQLSCARCHQSILNGHRHLPEVETHRSVPLPVAIGPAVRTLFAKGLKISILPIAIGMCQVPPIACQQAQSYSRCRSTSIIVSPVPNPIGPVVQTVFAKRLKIKCANRHVPSATNRFSMGTVIFPRSNHID